MIGTCASATFPTMKPMSFQYHPAASPERHDSNHSIFYSLPFCLFLIMSTFSLSADAENAHDSVMSYWVLKLFNLGWMHHSFADTFYIFVLDF